MISQQPNPPLNPTVGDVWAFVIPPALRYFDGTAWRQTDRWVPAIPPIIAIPWIGNYSTGVNYRGFTRYADFVSFARLP